MKNIFEKLVTDGIIERINKLSPDSRPVWGEMSVAQMLAHYSVSYELIYEDKHPRPNGFIRFLLRSFVKDSVVNDKPYKKNSRTGPAFLITDEKEFMSEKERLVNYIIRTYELGAVHFDLKESHSFGKLSLTEWSNTFYKHLDHHLNQFSV